jgi:glycolate oxidase FAD binding subunit
MSRVVETLAAAGQMLPVDVPQPGTATLGGVVAAQAVGPRVFGHGPLRHFVLGLRAVEGRGAAFRAGGSLTKGVVSPDVSRLLIGSFGTLAVITELTVRVRPAPQRTAVVACAPADLPEAERLLAAMPQSAVSPVAIELLWGAAWQDAAGMATQAESPGLAVLLEGADDEVEWMAGQLCAEWRELGVGGCRALDDAEAAHLRDRLAEFPAADDSAIVLQAVVPPSRVTEFVGVVRGADRACSIQSHAGDGIVIVRLSAEPGEKSTRKLVGRLQSAARAAAGCSFVRAKPVTSTLSGDVATEALGAPRDLLQRLKREFDPKNLLNPGRFWPE